MKLRASHPGFYKTMDYIGLINERMVTNFEDRVGFNVIFAAARAAGFSTEDAGDLAVTVGAGTIKGSIGGKGIMSARRV